MTLNIIGTIRMYYYNASKFFEKAKVISMEDVLLKFSIESIRILLVYIFNETICQPDFML